MRPGREARRAVKERRVCRVSSCCQRGAGCEAGVGKGNIADEDELANNYLLLNKDTGNLTVPCGEPGLLRGSRAGDSRGDQLLKV